MKERKRKSMASLPSRHHRRLPLELAHSCASLWADFGCCAMAVIAAHRSNKNGDEKERGLAAVGAD